MMDRRIVSLLLCLTLVLSAVPFLSAAAAEDVGLNPPPEWWGMSRTAFTSAYKDEQFTEIEEGETVRFALKRPKVHLFSRETEERIDGEK